MHKSLHTESVTDVLHIVFERQKTQAALAAALGVVKMPLYRLPSNGGGHYRLLERWRLR